MGDRITKRAIVIQIAADRIYGKNRERTKEQGHYNTSD